MKEIDRPLGLDRPAARRLVRPDAAGIATLACALAVLAVSTAIAFRERPFRAPAVVAVAEPDDTSGAGQAARTGGSEKTERREPGFSPGASITRIDGTTRDPSAGGSIITLRDPTEIGQDERVAHLPDRSLIEDGPEGPLPVRAEDGRRPFDVYARPWSGARGARVAIVVGGLGLSQTGTQEAIQRLPAQVTLAFAPQGNSIDRWMQEARRKGHEIVMQAPMEPFDYPSVDPGRNTLTVDADPEENIERLRWALSRTTNYTGVMNYMGARFIADREAMDAVMAELGDRGLMFLDDGSTARSKAGELARDHRVPFAAGDTAIDGRRERGAILEKLDELERIARAKGFAIGWGSAFDVTVDAVSDWVREARKRGVEIVPVSALADDPEKASN
ncbi:MAG: divergent polysaccharide deacetylase family protein [Rhizobiaceae bacterium]|nr:divergent polysaccharide deacetylase family protein [Rhizobiaceae bacterium]MCV0406042.1 divergent polysaccharide deacetylase family protein [Rhizobiaceae bacterium]